MRQTLWAEQMIEHKADEDIKADHYLHIHIIPSADSDLLDKKYRPAKNNNMEESWRACIIDQSKYVIFDPKDFLSPIQSIHPKLWEYLCTRYYEK